MEIKGKRIQKIKKLMSTLLVFFLLTGLFGGVIGKRKVQAARTEDLSESSQIIYFEDGSSLTVESDEQTMTITGTHIKSAARISYITTGYNMTLDVTGGYVEEKEFRKIKLIEKNETITDEVTTSYVLDRQSIVDGAYALFKKKHPEYTSSEVWMEFVKEISTRGGIEFYLHNIFAVIRRTGGSGSTVTATSKSYNNLGSAVGVRPKVPGILNAVEELYGSDWGAGTKKKLPEYYDIHLKLFVKPTKTTVVLATPEKEILATIKTNYQVYQNALVRFYFKASLKQEIQLGENIYRITPSSIRKSFVQYGNGIPSQFYSLSGENGLKIRLNTGEVSFRQQKEEPSVVYLICEKINSVEKPPDEITESGELWRIQEMEPENQLHISAWELENPYFNVEDEGIPVNENLVVNGEFWKYLLEAEFETKNGEITFQVPVRRTYRLVWQEIVGYIEESPIYQSFEDTRSVEVYVPVIRKYSYAQINDLNYCGLSEFFVENATLPEGELRADIGEGILAGIEIPEISYLHYDGQEAHIQYPPEVEAGIDLPTRTIDGGLYMPSVPQEDFTAIADEQVSKIKVRNDAFSFDRKNYLTDEWKEFEPGMEIGLNQVFSELKDKEKTRKIYSEALLIPEKIENGMYESMGEIVYAQISTYPDSGTTEEEYRFELDEVNHVNIHTPVYCAVHIESDNKKYTQLASPLEDAIPLVLDPEGKTSGMWIGISNTGLHSQKKGYGERDYSKTLKDSEYSYLSRDENGLLRNEVRFPFDVFLDAGMLYDTADDTYIPAGSWVVIGQRKARFYLPEWVFEGSYEVECRSVAVNCPDDTQMGEGQANRQEENYIATDELTVQVSGRICGLSLYDIADYPVWEEVFREESAGKIKNLYEDRRNGTVSDFFDRGAWYRYFSGMADSYGQRRASKNQYILPVLAGGHPAEKNAVTKTGYTIRFLVTTIGEKMGREDSFVRIFPHFFWVDKYGGNRREVDLYYTRRLGGKKKLIKIGNSEDSLNIKMQNTKSEWLGLPEIERLTSARVWGGVDEEVQVPMYSYAQIDGNRNFRTAKNFSYCNDIMRRADYIQMEYRGISEEKLLSLEQGNYFEYSLPYDVMAVDKGYEVNQYAADYGIDFTENFWKKEGFLIVSFEILAMVRGSVYLNYDNTIENGILYCNMWELEDVQKLRRDKNGTSFRFYPGDVLVFPVMDSIRNDHYFGGIY